jgi:hypothetical protein
VGNLDAAGTYACVTRTFPNSIVYLDDFLQLSSQPPARASSISPTSSAPTTSP